MSMFESRFNLRCQHCGLRRDFRNKKSNDEVDEHLRSKGWVVVRNGSGDLTFLCCNRCAEERSNDRIS